MIALWISLGALLLVGTILAMMDDDYVDYMDDPYD